MPKELLDKFLGHLLYLKIASERVNFVIRKSFRYL